MFWGDSRVDSHYANQVHEPTKVVTIPLLVLAALSIVTGYIGIPEFLELSLPRGGGGEKHDLAGMSIMLLTTLASFIGFVGAYTLYVRFPEIPDRLMNQWTKIYQGSLNKWYIDEAYEKTFVYPTFRLADYMWKKIDVVNIDGAVNVIARRFALSLIHI